MSSGPAVESDNIDLIRERIWYTYTTPSEISVTTEATIQNVGSETISRFQIGNLPSSTRILEAFNASEERLVLLNVNPPTAEIEFCEDGIRPGQYKIIRLRYAIVRYDEDRGFRRIIGAQFNILFRRRNFSVFIEQLFFSTERRKVEFGRAAGENQEVLVHIHAPTGFELSHRLAVIVYDNDDSSTSDIEARTTDMLLGRTPDIPSERMNTNSLELSENRSRIYESGHASDFVQIRIPETNTNNSQNIHGAIVYAIKPNKTERRFVMATVFALFGISLILNLLVIDGYYTPFLQSWGIPNLLIKTNNFSDKFFEISAGIATISIAIAALTRDPLAGRARYGYLVATVACIIAFILYSIDTTTAEVTTLTEP